MIDRIWHLRGTAELPVDVSDEVALKRLEAFLEKQHKPITARNETSVQFCSPLWEDWQTSNWLALVIYDEGRFWIERGLSGGVLRYDLRSLHGLVFCLLAGLAFFAFVGSVEGPEQGAKSALLTFAWLYGANMVLAWARIPFAIRRALESE